MASGDTKTESYLRAAAEGTRADLPADSCCNTKTQNLILGVANRIMDVEDEVEEIKNNPDVADIVPTYADLQNYDTSTLTDKDIIRVLQDETHDGDSTYYRYSISTGEFTYVGESKQYTDFVGTDGTSAGESGLVPAPAAADVDKFLKSDGTWDVAGGGPTVVQTTGTSTTDVMSQNAVTSMVYADPATKRRIKIGESTSLGAGFPVAIGSGTYTLGDNQIAIGRDANAGGNANNLNNVAIGYDASASGGSYRVAIGSNATANKNYSVALGNNATASRVGEVNIGTGSTTRGYNSTSYRVLGGVHDPVDAHDAATKGYVDAQAGGSLIKKLTTADFNWNTTTSSATEPYDCVALWLLEPGIYDTSGLTQVTQWRFHKDWDGSGNDGGVRIVLKVPKSFSNSTNVLIGISGQGSFSRFSKLFEWDVYDNGTKSIDTVITYSMI